MKTIPHFVYGTQYYRAPSPVPANWEEDFRKLKGAGLNAIQLRVQWRWNEPAENQYRFDDLDRLFDLAEEHGHPVIVKFMMECAPDYIFHKYGGTRRDMHGQPLAPGAHGAFYIGGWIPCFDHPGVVKRAEAFVAKVVRRYRARKNLLLWNVWNEPRSRPIAECGCGHSIAAYRVWLREQYGNVAVLNETFGKAWESLETVMPPGMPYDYVELFLWRRWAFDAVTQRLQFMYRAVKKLDAKRPVISHVGGCSVVQDAAGDCSDDVANAAVMDFYGTSYPVANHFTSPADDAFPFLISDWMRSVSPYFWVYELYPDWGNWLRPVSLEDFRLKVWSAVAGGAKGLVFWQYRAERLGNEDNLSGLVEMSGDFKPVTHESARIAPILAQHSDFLMRAQPVEDAVAIVYDRDSDLISRIENTGGPSHYYFWNFDLRSADGLYPYKRAIQGAYALFREAGFVPRFIDSRQLADRLEGIKLLYLPEWFMVTAAQAKVLEAFVKNGGRIIAEEGTGLRQANTWLHERLPGAAVSRLFGVRTVSRVYPSEVAETLSYAGHAVLPGEYVNYLEPVGSGTVLAPWADGRAGIVATDRTVFLGTSLGAAFFAATRSTESSMAVATLVGVLRDLCRRWKITPRHPPPLLDVHLRELSDGRSSLHFIFNRSSRTVRLPLPAGAVVLTPATRVSGKGKLARLEIAPFDTAVYGVRLDYS
jgi:beta-galactosidase GanA